jgi:glycine cleavage system H protein
MGDSLMKTPKNLSYSPQHLWVKKTDSGSFLAGITDYAQDALGDIVFVELPAVGQIIHAGQPCGLLESVKTGSDLYAPLDGVIEAINDELPDSPELINDVPYTSWIFQFKPSNPADIKKLLSAEAYAALISED